MCVLPVPILKNLRVQARAVILAKTRSKLDSAMNAVIVSDKPADEANDDDGWREGWRDFAGRAN